MIPFIDLKAQNDALRPELEQALARVLDSGVFALGQEVEAFEEAFAAYCGATFAVAMASGTAALQLALAALDVGPGDEVIVPPFTFIATSAVVRYLGATPVFADIDPVTYTLDPDAAAAALTSRTRAIMPVHLFGQAAELDALCALARQHGVALVEDAAQAHGAEYRGRRVGSFGALSGFSFYPTKNLGALGEGGLVTTDDADLAEKLRLLRNWGQQRKYRYEFVAYNARMAGFQGALLRVKLPHLERWNEKRRALAARYDALLPEVGIEPPREAPGRRHVYHIYNVRVPQRDQVLKALHAEGIGAGAVYPHPLHLQPVNASLGYRAGAFPEAERAAAEVLALPMYPELADDAPEQVVQALGRVRSAKGGPAGAAG